MASAALTRIDSASYLVALDRAAGEAATATGGFEDHFHRVAGLTLRLRFAGPALVPHITAAVAHLRVPPTPEPHLTIRIWDSEVAGAPPPPATAEGGTIRGSLDDGDGRFIHWDGGSLTVLDAARDRAWHWVDTGGGRSGPDRAAPLSSILRSWLAQRKIHLVHAAGVGTREGCVLIVGGRGAGKSTAALACVAAGLGCLGDDTCLIGPQEPPTISSLYNTAQADKAVLEGLGFLDGGPWAGDGGGKGLGFLQERAMLREAPLRAIAVARVGARRHSRVRPATPGEALAALAPTSILRLPGPAQSTLSRLARVLEGSPCHYLEVGADPEGVADAVKALL